MHGKPLRRSFCVSRIGKYCNLNILLCFFLFFLYCLSPHWVEANPVVNTPGNLQPKKLVIGTKQSPPFAFKDQTGQWKGISIELWEAIAKNLKYDYVFKEYDLQGLLNAVENKSIDAAVAALTITSEREKRFDFTHPFHTSGLGIAVLQGKENSWLVVFNRFLSPAFLEVVLALVLLLFVVGLLVWFFERKKNREQFGGSFLAGIGSGFWWSAVTMTTVGYGDKAPRTLGGRLVGLVWMFIAIIIISSFTAAITSTLTVNQIQQHVRGPEDLNRVKVGSIKHSTSASYLNTQRISFQDYSSVMDALQGLEAGEVDAVVYDAPILRYLVNRKMQNKIQVLNTIFEKQQYGIGLPTASPLREKINRLVPAIISDRKWQDILFRYLGEPAS
ncbi:MAG: transporter substrate-binding domain-containing protein [Pseudomonadota bacterium]